MEKEDYHLWDTRSKKNPVDDSYKKFWYFANHR